MDIQAIRQAAIETPLKVQSVATPFWVLPDGTSTDGQVYLRDVPGDEIIALRASCMENGQLDSNKFGALLAIKCLVAYDNDHNLAPVFGLGDLSTVQKFGSTIQTPLGTAIGEFLGTGTSAVADAKKNSNQTTSQDSGTSLPETSAAAQ